MVRLSVLVAAAAALFAVAWPSVAAAQSQSLTDAVVKIDGGGSGGHGTGFVVSPRGHILTSLHVIAKDGQDRIVIFSQGGRAITIRARLIETDEANDLALLQAEIAARPICPANVRGKQGQRVFKLGYGGSTPEIVSREDGTIASSTTLALPNGVATRSFWDGPPRKTQRIGVTTASGDSGGPVLNEAGQFIGVVCCGIEKASLMVPVDNARGILSAADYSPEECLTSAIDEPGAPSFLQAVVGDWTGTFACAAGLGLADKGTLNTTFRLEPDGKLTAKEDYDRGFPNVANYRGEPTSDARTLRMKGSTLGAGSYEVELRFNEDVTHALGTYIGHRNCSTMELRKVQ